MDYRLIELCRAGDAAAVEDFVQTYQREVYSLALSILDDSNEAEDATQESLLAALRGLGSFQGSSSLKTWLFSITVSTCCTRLQRRKRAETLKYILNGGFQKTPAPSVEEDAIQKESNDALLLSRFIRGRDLQNSADSRRHSSYTLEHSPQETVAYDIERSPDGNLAFVSHCIPSGWTFYRANPDGTTIHELLSPPLDPKYDGVFDLSWSQDDHFLAFMAVDEENVEIPDLYILNANDPSAQPLKMENSSGPSWQPAP